MTNERESDVTDDSRVDVEPKYWGNVLSAFEAGVQMDLRLRLAMDFLKSPLFENAAGGPRVVASGALDLATALLDEAAARGMLKALPETDEITSAMRHHVGRSARAQVAGQASANRAMREEAGGVMPAGGSIMHPGLNG